jgi:hypothetical protein
MSISAGPGAGDTAAIRTIVGSRRAAAASVERARAIVADTVRDVDRAWRGATGRAIRSSLELLAPDLGSTRAMIDRGADVLDRYARTLDALADEQRRIERARSDAHDAVATLDRTLQRIDEEPTPTAADLVLRGRTVDELGSVRDELGRLDDAWDALVRDRERADRTCIDDLRAKDAIGLLSRTPRTSLLSDDAFLAFLARLGPAEVAAAFAREPGVAGRLAGLDPELVADWWRTMGAPGGPSSVSTDPSCLTPTQLALVSAIPSVLGTLPGISFGARDLANRLMLRRRIEQLEGAAAASTSSSATERLRAQLRPYRRVLAALSGKALPRASLVSLDTSTSPPLAAIGIGSIDTARDVTYLVPGMGSSTLGMTGWVRGARNLWTAQAGTGPRPEHAVIAWMNYETPDTTTVDRSDHARAGARRLVGDLDALTVVRRPIPRTHVVAHSYGTTTAALALASPDLDHAVDTFVCLGSAGIDRSIRSVADLAAGRVLAAEAPEPSLPFVEGGGDQWAYIGRNVSGRTDPRAPAFGAEVMDISATDDLAGVGSHSAIPNAEGQAWHGYLDEGTAALRATAEATSASPPRP